jgi:glycerol kinase
MHYYLAIDQGTHSSRALVFDEKGNAVASASQTIDLQRLDTHRVEQSARQILASVRTVIDDCLAALTASQLKHVVSCGLCTQRSTVVAMDPAGHALGPALSWQDTRGSNWLQSFAGSETMIQSISGLPLSPHYGVSKMHWLDQNSSPSKQERILTPLAGYLVFNLVNSSHPYVDHCNAQRTQLMDLQTQRWSAELLQLFQLEHINLPACIPVCHDYGELLETGIPLKAVSGDQNATVYGSGEFPADEALVNFGSGAFILRTEARLEKSKLQLNSIGYSDSHMITWLKEGTINGCGTALSWAAEKWDLRDMKVNLPGWLATVRQPGVFLNSIGGIGSPWWNSDLKAEMVDSGDQSKGAYAVAVLESILFLIMDNLQLMQRIHPVNKLRVSGGLSQLDGLCRKLANLTQLEVERLHNPEATARGIAWLAAGRPDNWLVFPSDTFHPRQDISLWQRYDVFSENLRKRLE